VGGEFIYNKSLSFRLGYRFRNKMADADTLLYGLGYTYRNWTADYALVPYLNLGSTHRLSLEYKF